MNKKDKPDKSIGQDQSSAPRHRVRLPGFITDEEIGLGDVVKRTTAYLGISACGGCDRRAARLNRWLFFKNSKAK